LLQPFNTDNVTLSPETNITADLNIDSVAMLDLIMEVEDLYEVSFPVNQLSEIRTIGDLVGAIQQQREGSH
jgi:acyl carrier protein